MSSKRHQVLQAVKGVGVAALPNADVIGLDSDEAKPDEIGPGGKVIVRSGDPGEPDILMSPRTYTYEHAIPIEVAAYRSATKTSEQVLDEMIAAFGAQLAADRTLGGLCEWAEATAPTVEDFDAEGAEAGAWATFDVIAVYSTSDPLN